jgi:hypothetical protein
MIYLVSPKRIKWRVQYVTFIVVGSFFIPIALMMMMTTTNTIIILLQGFLDMSEDEITSLYNTFG